MPRKSKGAHLYLRQRSGIFIIRENGIERSTGTRDRRKAETALSRYIAERDRPIGRNTPDKMTVADALDLYGNEHAPTCKDPVRIAYAIQALVPVLGAMPLSSINGGLTRHYERTRDRSPATVRKELGVLQAAINYCHTEGYLTAPVKVKLPAKTPPVIGG